MEKVIRDACQSGKHVTDFEAIISYASTTTQVPSHYSYTYKIDGELVVDAFDNTNPESYHEESHDIAAIDTNSNGIVTIAEAKTAGFKMPITSDHWLYPYMVDGDGDGMVGE
ncbi:MAG: hypothetical protein JXR88_04110 [Clostridia bacterium]|nr:hypothetical protein [Clostridia bacterium]